MLRLAYKGLSVHQQTEAILVTKICQVKRKIRLKFTPVVAAPIGIFFGQAWLENGVPQGRPKPWPEKIFVFLAKAILRTY